MRVPVARPDSSLIVLCAANNWDDVTLSDRPLARELKDHAPVLYVDPPLSHLSPRNNPRIAASLKGPRLRLIEPGLLRYTPVVAPLPFRRPMLPLTRLTVRAGLSRVLRQLGSDVQAVVSTFLLIDVFDLAPSARHLYWMQDDVAAGAAYWNQNQAILLRGERRVVESADAILAASPLAALEWRARGHNAHVLPNGCDLARFDQPSPEVGPQLGLPRPVAGFVGHLNERTDLEYLQSVVDHDVSLLIVGPISESVRGPALEALLESNRVRSVGPQPYDELGAWLSGIDVGLVPYRNDDFNRYSFPLKTLEYLAAGIPVVSTDLPATQWLDTQHIATATTPSDFGAAAASRSRVGQPPDAVEARRAFARGHSWSERARTLAKIIAAEPPDSPAVRPAGR